jgi:hypothetical protein
MTARTQRLTRRNFLLTVGAGGAAAAAALAAKSSSSPASPAKNKHETRGYHATAHVNDYYRTTKV